MDTLTTVHEGMDSIEEIDQEIKMKRLGLLALLIAAIGLIGCTPCKPKIVHVVKIKKHFVRVPVIKHIPIRIRVPAIVILKKIYFNKGSHKLTKKAQTTLDAVERILNHRGFNTLGLRVEGHANKNKRRGVADTLSMLRAAEVCEYLVFKGVAAPRLKLRSYGGTQPYEIAPGSIPANRRVEMFFIQIKLKVIK